MDGDLAVLHVSQPVEGGVARYVDALVADQLRRGWRVVVAAPGSGELASRIRSTGAAHTEWAATRNPGPSVPGETRRLRRIVEAAGPDVVHLHSSKAGLAGRLALRARQPTVFQPHGWSFDAVSGLTRIAATRWERIGARWAHALVCVSAAERQAGEEAGIRASWHEIPNGVDLEAFTPATAEERRRARSRLGLASGPLVVCVGRLCDAKGQDVLLAAWPPVLDAVPAASLALVGDGPDRAALEAVAGPRVLIAGERDDVPDWLAAADVVAIPSRREGMSLVMLEALARARSVVSTDVPGARELLGEVPNAVVPIEQPDPLAHALVERLRDPERCEREGTAGRAVVERSHDWRQTAAKVADVYAALIRR